MKETRYLASLLLRYLVWTFLYLFLCYYFGVLDTPVPKEVLLRMQLFAASLLAIPVLFYPEITRLSAKCEKLKNTREDRFLALCDFLIALTPVPPYGLRAEAFSRLDRYEEAKADADLAIKLAPDDWIAWHTRASISAELHEYDTAIKDADRAVALAPSNTTALTKRAFIRNGLYDLQGCLEDCTKIEALGKSNGYTRLLTIDCYLKNEDIAAAETVAKKIKGNIKPESLDAYALARLKTKQNKFEEVVTICKQVSDDKYFAYWFLDELADAYADLNEGALAMQTSNRALALKPKMSNAYINRAAILARAGFLDKALAECQRDEVSRKQSHTGGTQGYVRFLRGEYSESLECAHIGLKRLPKLAYSHALHGLALAGLEQFDEAILSATRATELNPLSSFAWYALAYVQLKQDKIEDAIKSLDSGVAVNPHYRNFYQLRAEAHKRAGNNSEAASDQTKSDQLQAQFMANLDCNIPGNENG